jgi:hypothetical protein
MKKTISLSIIAIMILLFTGCGQQVQPPLYIWDNYVGSSADYAMHSEKKDITEKQIQVLKKIINESEEKKQRVAPGIYAEYGQILFRTNHKTQAKKYFLLEKQTYPESSKFIDMVITKLYGDAK